MEELQSLKSKILSLAIQGKLTAQSETDEPASVLLQKIKEEKERLVKEKKIKKDKFESVIYKKDNCWIEKIGDTEKDITKDIPFDIPDSWQWVRLGNISINRDNERIPLSSASRKKMDKLYDYYGASGVIDKVDNFIFSEELLLIGEDGANLITRSKPLAFIAKGKYWVNNHAHVLDFFYDMTKYYILTYINGISLEKYVKGSAQPKLTQDNLNLIVIPLPPIAEQERIVKKVEEIFKQIEVIQKSRQELDNLKLALKNKLLSLAIQGKLAKQTETDTPVAELLQKIQEEKNRLVKEKKIKKDKLESHIYKKNNRWIEKIGDTEQDITNDIPFEIPDSWQWVRLGSISSYIQRGKSPKYSLIKKYPVIAQKCNQWSGIYMEKAQFIEPETLKSYSSERILQDKDLLWNSTGTGTLGRIGIYYSKYNPYELAVADSHITVIRLFNNFILPEYCRMYLASPIVQNVIEEQADGSTQQKELSLLLVKSYLFPLPPIEEQHRITQKLEKFFSLCENL